MTSPVLPEANQGGRSRSVLEEEREFFLRSLRDLEAERTAGDIDDLDYRALRDDYTVRAAHVLRQLAFLDGEGPDPDAAGVGEAVAGEVSERAGGERAAAEVPEPAGAPMGGRGLAGAGGDAGAGSEAGAGSGAGDQATTGAGDRVPRARASWRRRLVIGVAVALIVGGVFWAVSGAAGVRLPGEEVSGQSNTSEATDQLLVAGETASHEGDPSQAMKDYEAVLKVRPDSYEALTGAGSILVQAGVAGKDNGLIVKGLDDLRQAEIIQPSYAPAYGARGLALYYEGDYAGAIPQLETYLADTPARSRAAGMALTLSRAKAAQAKQSR